MNSRKWYSKKVAIFTTLCGIMVALLLLSTSGASGNADQNRTMPAAPSLDHFLGDDVALKARQKTVDALPSYKTAPSDLPRFTVERWPGALGTGLIFVTQFYSPLAPERQPPAYLMILDNNGEPVYFNNAEQARALFDFKKQRNGQLTYFVAGDNHNIFYAMNDEYRVVADYQVVGTDPETGLPYTADAHDLQILNNGNALLLLHDHRTVDMSQYHPDGKTDADVVGCIIQEIDQDGDLVFQWDGWEYFEITDTVMPLDGNPLLYVHCNSIGEDHDGNLLLSSRGLEEITKIHRKTGEIMWRLGGKNNQFEFLDDEGFAYQHDARRIANGHLTLFDNGFAREPEFSRGVEYELDEQAFTAKRIKEFRTTPDTWGPFMGNAQTLPNDNVMVGWGFSIEADLSEFDSSGNQLLRMTSDTQTFSYRAFRFPWKGYPTWPPELVVIQEGSQAKLYFSWNGSTETAAYEVFAGQNKHQMESLAVVPKDGFESSYTVDLTGDGFWYFSVTPIDKNGVFGQPSDIVSVVLGGYSSYMPLATSN